MTIQQYPASSGGAAATTPIGATNLVFSALTGTGDYTYTGTVTAGVYAFSGNSQDNSRVKISGSSFAAYTNGNDAPVYFNIPTTESSVSIGQAGVLGVNSWEGVNTNLSNWHIKSIARVAGNTYLAGAVNGLIIWSTDGLNWSSTTNYNGNANGWINQGYDIKLTEGNGIFLQAVGDSTYGQAMATSTDGVYWQEVDFSSMRTDIGNLNLSSVQGVKYIHDRFFALYTNALMMWSTSGTSWYNTQVYQAHFRSGTKIGSTGNWVFTGASPSIQYSTDLITWTSRNPVSVTLNDIVWSTSQNQLVAVGEQTRFAYSTDGITWTGGQIGAGNTLNSIAFGNGNYVAVGTSGHAYYSTDGVSWSTAFINNSINPGQNLQKIVFKQNKFITGDGAYLYQSTDGITWGTSGNTPYIGYNLRNDANSDTIVGVYGYTAYSKNNGAIFDTIPIVPFGGYNVNKILYSPSPTIKYHAVTDWGILWSTNATSGWNSATPNQQRYDTYWKDVCRGGSTVATKVAVGTNGWISHSNDGATWSSNFRADPAGQVDANACVYWNGYVLVGYQDGNIIWSTVPGNGPSAWQSVGSLGGAIKTMYALDGGTLIAAGANGLLKTSTNGTTWTSRDSKFGSVTIRHIERQDNATFVAVGDNGTMRVSTDGITWTTRLSGTTNRLLQVTPKSLSSNLGTIVVGENSTMLVNNDNGLTSYLQVPVGRLTGDGAIYNRRIRYLNNNYLQSDNLGNIVTSTNGTTWTKTLFTFGNTQAMRYFSGKYLIGNDRGYIYTSTNLVTWTTANSGFYTPANQYTDYYSIKEFVTGPSTVLAIGGSGRMSTSTDGVTWTTRTSPLALNNSLQAGIYYNNLFIITDGVGLIATSTDAITWTIRKSPLSSEYIMNFAADSTKVIGITNTSNVYYSADGTTWVAGATSAQTGTSNRALAAGNSMFVSGPNTGTLTVNNISTSLNGTFSDKVTYNYQYPQQCEDIEWVASQNTFLLLGSNGMLMKQVPPVKAMPITAFLYSTNITKVN